MSLDLENHGIWNELMSEILSEFMKNCHGSWTINRFRMISHLMCPYGYSLMVASSVYVPSEPLCLIYPSGGMSCHMETPHASQQEWVCCNQKCMAWIADHHVTAVRAITVNLLGDSRSVHIVLHQCSSHGNSKSWPHEQNVITPRLEKCLKTLQHQDSSWNKATPQWMRPTSNLST